MISAYRDYLREEYKEGTKTLYRLKNQTITLEGLVNVKLTGDKSIAINDEDIDQFLDFEKGPYTFMVLSLLYPQLRFDQVQFHQDHIHPRSRINRQEFRRLGVTEEKTAELLLNRDKLPNLQLMEGRENESKRAKPFEEWLNGSGLDKATFFAANYIPPGTGLGLENFEAFYNARRSLLKIKIKQVLNA